MLFHTTISPKAGVTHEDAKKSLEMWLRWKQPEGFEIKSFWLAPDGRGFLIVEAETAESAYEATGPWVNVNLDYDIVPIIEIEKAVPLMEKAIAFREA